MGLLLHIVAIPLRKMPLSSACSCPSSCAAASSKRGGTCSNQKSHDVNGEIHKVGALFQHFNRSHSLALLTSGIYVHVRT